MFRAAAIWLATRREEGCCSALIEARAPKLEKTIFRKLFKPRNAATYWWKLPYTPSPSRFYWLAEEYRRELQETKLAHNARILALLFAAEIAKDMKL